MGEGQAAQQVDQIRRTIVLPFPPAALSGHNKGSWWRTRPLVKQHRTWAWNATMAVKPHLPGLPSEGDIPILIRFVPPNRRGDRTNYPNRCKALIDGVADALNVNDKRFLPRFEYAEPQAPGRVEIVIGSAE